MKKVLAYDLPTRIFHWAFAALFVGGFAIAKLADDDSPWFPYHMLLGMVTAAAVFSRIVWGFVGSSTARFSSFSLRPKALAVYFGQLLAGRTERTLGHNPASSWAAVALFALALGLAGTGILMASGVNKEFFEEVHELFANAFLVIALLHVAGVVLHSFVHKDSIALSMLHGKKCEVPGGNALRSAHPWAGTFLVLVLGVFAFGIWRQYDPSQKSLNLPGFSLQLGEHEGGEKGEESEDD